MKKHVVKSIASFFLASLLAVSLLAACSPAEVKESETSERQSVSKTEQLSETLKTEEEYKLDV